MNGSLQVPVWVLTALYAPVVALGGLLVRMYMQTRQNAAEIQKLNDLKAAWESANKLEADELGNIKLQMAVFQTQLTSVFDIVKGIATKVDSLVEKVAKQDGRSGRSS